MKNSPGSLFIRLWLVFAFASVGFAPACAATTAFFNAFTRLDHAFWYVSNGWANGNYQSCEWRADAVSASSNSLQLRLSGRGGKVRPIGCAEIHTNMRLGYGLYEARLRTAAGSGLNTAFFTYVGPPTGSPQWDEIDFEFLGKDPHSVQVNYFTDGKPQSGIMAPLGFDASKAFHDYAIEWTAAEIRWYVDGRLVQETPAGAAIPRNPGRLYFSLWSGSKEEDAWLGPFHYTEPAAAEVAWTGFTPAGEPCHFPQSLKCRKQAHP